MILPYPLENDAETGLYSFTTNKNVRYICRFRDVTSRLSPLLGIYDLEIFDFDFYPENEPQDKVKFDAAICMTICDLFTRFFTSDLRVLVYICDSSDERHQYRDHLFNLWHSRHVAHLLTRIAIEISIGDEPTYGCALVTHQFPHMDVLQSELIDKIDEFMIDKYGL